MIEDLKIKENAEKTKEVSGSYIPGNNYLGIDGVVSETVAIKVEQKNSIILTGNGYPKLSPPIIVAEFDSVKDVIVLDGLVFVDSKYGAGTDDFMSYLNFSFSSDGGYQLDLYTVLDKKSSVGVVNTYDVFGFQIILNKKIHDRIVIPPFSEITTVEAFVVDEDPETSRGTVTTVKSTT